MKVVIKNLQLNLFLFFIFFSLSCFAQKGKDGDMVITSNIVLNNYADVTTNISIGSTTITVSNVANLNGGTYYANPNLSVGDLLMIYQPQGASMTGAATAGFLANPDNDTWGGGIVYNNAGNYEFIEVKSINSALNQITVCPTKNSYIVKLQVPINGTANCYVGVTYNTTYTNYYGLQVVRVPRFKSLTVNTGVTITGLAWDDSQHKGGIIAIEAQGSITVNGTINATGIGFKGGKTYKTQSLGGDPSQYTACGFTFYNAAWDDSHIKGAIKGEGIVGSAGPHLGGLAEGKSPDVHDGGALCDYTSFGGRFGRGAPANGGGGGQGHNSGGGGGANAAAGNIISGWTGKGVPDPTYNSCWARETPSISGVNSLGGGRGGYSYAANNVDPTTKGPDNIGVWSGDGRKNNGGLGGRPLDYSTPDKKLFFGGGGGAGDSNDGIGSDGSSGGGLIYLMADDDITGTGQINANGADVVSNTSRGPKCGEDPPGGAGAGGAVVCNPNGTVSNLIINAKGGRGGDHNIMNYVCSGSDAYLVLGAGGGGGGGFIGLRNAGSGLTLSAKGGLNGISHNASSSLLAKFPPAGATQGGDGITDGVVNSILIGCGLTASLTASKPTICKGDSSILTLTVSGTTGTVTYAWSNGLGSGIAPIQVKPTITTTYSVTVTDQSPATVTATVAVTVSSPPTVNLTGGTICAKDTIKLTPTGADTYTWDNSLGSGTSKSVNPTITTTYNVTGTVTASGCINTAQATVTVNPIPVVTIFGATTICQGDNTTLTATGGGTYKWFNNSTNPQITVTPAHDSTFTVTVTKNSCTATKTHIVTITTKLHPIITTSDTTSSVCIGGSILLKVSGATSYSWSTGSISQTINTNALIKDSIYTVTVYGSGIGCSGDTSIKITINPSPIAKITGVDTICDGQTAVLTASGGTTYSWSTTEISPTIKVNPLLPTTYVVTAYSNYHCPDTTFHVIKIKPNPNPWIMNSIDNICSGSNVTITAAGGTSYLWSNAKTDAVITVSPTTIGENKYKVTVTKANCSTVDSTIIKVMSLPDNPQINGISLCSNDLTKDETLMILQPSANYVYRWYDALTGGTLLAQGTTYSIKQVSAPHTFYVETISADSCHSSTRQTVSILMYDPPIVQFDYQPKPIVLQNAPVQMINQSTSTDGIRYDWMFGENLYSTNAENPYYIFSDTGLFTITLKAITDHKCQATDSMSIYVKARLFLWIPEVFTPNNDGKNDVFVVRGPVKTMTLEVYNQWGFRVFKSEKQEDGWDGKYQGVEQPEGNYAWTLKATTTDDQPVKKQGLIVLMR